MGARVYFLQILDKSCVGYGATFGLQTQAVSSTAHPLETRLLMQVATTASSRQSILAHLLIRLLGSIGALLWSDRMVDRSCTYENAHEYLYSL